MLQLTSGPAVAWFFVCLVIVCVAAMRVVRHRWHTISLVLFLAALCLAAAPLFHAVAGILWIVSFLAFVASFIIVAFISGWSRDEGV